MAVQVVAPGLPGTIDTEPQVPLGTTIQDEHGYTYIYLQGIGSTVVGSAVTYDSDFLTTLLAANGVGMVAFATAATVANTYGWYGVQGVFTARSNGNVANNAALYATGTGGEIDDAVVSGDLIASCFAASAATGAVAFSVRCNFPFVTNTLS